MALTDTGAQAHYHQEIQYAALAGGEEYSYLVAAADTLAPRAPIERSFIIKPKPREEAPYDKLYCDDKDKTTISEIISSMAEHGKFWLLRHRSHMNELGDSIRHVHPLKFMEVIFTSEYLTACMREVFDDYFKRNGFLDGIGETLTMKAKVGELDRYIKDFAKAVNAPLEAVQPYFTSMDWEGLIRYLMSR